MFDKLQPDTVCRTIFGLDYPPSGTALTKQYRSLIMSGPYRHPDKGGTSEGFRRLFESYELVKKAIQSGWVPVVTVNDQSRPKASSKPSPPGPVTQWSDDIIMMREKYAREAKQHRTSPPSEPRPRVTYLIKPHAFSQQSGGLTLCYRCSRAESNDVHSPSLRSSGLPLPDLIIKACLYVGGVASIIGLSYVALILLKVPSSYYMFWL